MGESRGGAPVAAVSVVRSPAVRAQVEDAGYATIPLLSREELAGLAEAHGRIARPDDTGLTIDYMRPDRRPMERIRSEVLPLLDGAFTTVFDDPRVIMATFVTKHPGAESAMFLHEDRVFVDETFHRSVTAWIPLTATGRRIPNGALEVVPGSHRLPVGPSGSNTADAIRPFEAELRRRLVTLDVAAGCAALYDTRLVHASAPNLTDTPRTALVCVIAPRTAQPVHVVADLDGTHRFHAVDEEFFVLHHPREVERHMPDRYPCVAITDAPRPVTAVDVESLPHR